jgi:hypothetical protein
MWRTAAIVTFVFLGPAVARAQTAEETVLYMIFGYEKDNVKHPFRGNITIKQQSSCKYLIVLDGLASKAKIEYSFDFSNLKQYAATQVDRERAVPFILGDNIVQVRVIDQTGKSEESRGNSFQEAGAGIFPFPASAVRMEKAASYFRSNFCKGRAF